MARTVGPGDYVLTIEHSPFFCQDEDTTLLLEDERCELLAVAETTASVTTSDAWIKLASVPYDKIEYNDTDAKDALKARLRNHPWLDPARPLSDAERRTFADDVLELDLSCLQADALPRAVYKFRNLRRLVCYGSKITHVSPQVALLRNLKEFIPYTSYGLHWLPFEIRHTRTRKAHISRRALYGFLEYRQHRSLNPVPRLPWPRGAKALTEIAARVVLGHGLHEREELTLPMLEYLRTAHRCSYCRGPYWDTFYPCWTFWTWDRVPLLALACSVECALQVQTDQFHPGRLLPRDQEVKASP